MTEPRLSEQRVNEQSMADGRVSSKCEQICQTLRRYIGSGQLGAGQQLPAERALSDRFATTRITIKEALSSLEADGLIYRAERRGWFVAPPRLTYDPAIHTHFHQWIGEQQRTAETRVLAHGSELASSELCRWMGLEPFTPLYEIRRQRLIDGRPVLHVSHHLLASRFPRYRQRAAGQLPHRALSAALWHRPGWGESRDHPLGGARRHRPRPQSGGGERGAAAGAGQL